MEQKHEDGGFRYSYSAKEQAELKRIREKYTPSTLEEDKMERVRRLDRGVTKKARTVSLVLGILGALIMGTGMSLAMTELSRILGTNAHLALPIGIAVGVFGMLFTALAYPVYVFTVKRERERIAPEILRLTEELMK